MLYNVNMRQKWFFFACFVMFAVCSTAWCEEVDETTTTGDTLVEVVEDSPAYIVSIERLKVGDMKLDDTLEIMLDSFGRPLAGFELKFALESPFINIDTVLPGEILDSCGWEFFNARAVNTQDKEGYPPVVWQAVGLAKTAPGGRGPTCYSLERQASIVRLVLSSWLVGRVPDTVVKIFFFWEDCSDNSIANLSGDTLAISARVFDYFGNELPQESNLFPNRTGATKQCIDPDSRNKPRRQIDFHNGGVEFKLDLGPVKEDTTEK